MTEDVLFRRRNKLKKHFVNTSNVLLYGYTALSDAAKITFQVIDGFDWENAETEDCKGYAFPSVATLAEIRHTSERTIYRHIKELEHVQLLTRVRRRNQPSILYIEDIATEEADTYLHRYVEKTRPMNKQQDLSAQSRTDKNVSSHKAPELTKMAVAYKKEENEKKENEINVNENFNISDEKKRYGMQGVGAILQRIDTVKPRPVQRPAQVKKTPVKQSSDEKTKRDYFATHIATEMQDEKSLGCYRLIAEKIPQHIIFETMASVKEAWKEGKIKKSRGALFVDIIKTYSEKHNIDVGLQGANT